MLDAICLALKGRNLHNPGRSPGNSSQSFFKRAHRRRTAYENAGKNERQEYGGHHYLCHQE